MFDQTPISLEPKSPLRLIRELAATVVVGLGGSAIALFALAGLYA